MPTAQPERNEPCPCGSGKKYKACCARTAEAAAGPPWRTIGLVVLGIALLVVLLYRTSWREEPARAATPAATPAVTPAPVTADAGAPTAAPAPLTLTPMEGAAPGSPQPEGPAPPGKVWSAEHGHWHDAAPAMSPLSPLEEAAAPRSATPAAAPGSPQPPGPAPPGKVWSTEHGHWHDAAPPAGTPTLTPMEPVATPGSPQPEGPAPPGKVWSSEHGHWHDAPP